MSKSVEKINSSTISMLNVPKEKSVFKKLQVIFETLATPDGEQNAFIKTMLASEEKIIHTARLHTGKYFFVGCVLLCCLIIPVPFVVMYILNRKNSERAVTDQRVIWKYGALKTIVKVADLNDVKRVDISQDLLGKFLNYGTVVFHNANGTPIKWDNITNFAEVQSGVQEHIQVRFKRLRDAPVHTVLREET